MIPGRQTALGSLGAVELPGKVLVFQGQIFFLDFFFFASGKIMLCNKFI